MTNQNKQDEQDKQDEKNAILCSEIIRKVVNLLNKEIPDKMTLGDTIAIYSTLVTGLTVNIYLSMTQGNQGDIEGWMDMIKDTVISSVKIHSARNHTLQ